MNECHRGRLYIISCCSMYSPGWLDILVPAYQGCPGYWLLQRVTQDRFPFSALTLLVLGDKKGIRPVKKLGVGLLVLTF